MLLKIKDLGGVLPLLALVVSLRIREKGCWKKKADRHGRIMRKKRYSCLICEVQKFNKGIKDVFIHPLFIEKGGKPP